MSLRIRDITAHLESIAPLSYQEDYDNAGLLTGDADAECTGVLTCLDSTEAVVAEAVEKGCNLVVAHHPILFRGLKRLTGAHYVERTIIRAIREGVALYAIHTNLDNVLARGVNEKIGQRLGLGEQRILQPAKAWLGWSARVGSAAAAPAAEAVGRAGFELPVILPSGAGEALLRGKVASGQAGRLSQLLPGIPLQTWPLQERNAQVGSGLLGILPQAMEEREFLAYVGERMRTNCIRHTALLGKPIQKVALCGGAGGFLLSRALAAGADAFLTADYKYHEFFEADGQLLLADMGHYESEQFTIDLLFEILSTKFPTFAVYSTEVVTNPVQYWFPNSKKD